ncbi:hypothetical protein [Ralstonia solanacearum]|nr:hypothetical protein [Ralstonia solanacearum]
MGLSDLPPVLVQRFDKLQKVFEADPFYASLPPPDDDEHVVQTIKSR